MGRDDGMLLRSNSYTTAMASERDGGAAASSEIAGDTNGSEGGTGTQKPLWRATKLEEASGAQVHRDTGHLPPHPLTRSLLNPIRLFEYVTFRWVNPLLDLGFTRQLQLADFYKLPPEQEAVTIIQSLQHAWEREVARAKAAGKEPWIGWAYWATFKWWMLFGGTMFSLEAGIQVGQSYMLGQLLEAIKVETDERCYTLAAGVTLFALAYALLHHTGFLCVWRLGQMEQAATIGMVYRKALRISQQALTQTTTGHVVNLVSNDAERFILAAIMTPWLFIAPTQLAVVTWLVYDITGWPSLLATVLLILLVPLQLKVGKYISYLRRETAKLTDERIKTMKELIAGMRVVKMQGWEEPFSKKVDQLRVQELSYIRTTSFIKGANMVLSFITPAVLAAVVFIPYAQTKGTLTAPIVFTTMSYFVAVRVNVTIFFAFGIQAAAELQVVFERLTKFMMLAEKEPVVKSGVAMVARGSGVGGEGGPGGTVGSTPAAATAVVVRLENFACAWDESKAILQNVTVDVAAGEVLGVVGPVGAGKSTLLAAILGEVPGTEGSVAVNGRSAYTSQESWILGETVRSNILFGLPMDVGRYEETIRACQLVTDLEAFPDGDLTEIGDRGITLSGGQKARISLARAVFADADIYLLDDPLSAVDATVGKLLVEECICGLLVGKRGASVILVTHQLQFLHRVDRVLMLDANGAVEGLGTVEELERLGKSFESARVGVSSPSTPTEAVSEDEAPCEVDAEGAGGGGGGTATAAAAAAAALVSKPGGGGAGGTTTKALTTGGTEPASTTDGSASSAEAAALGSDKPQSNQGRSSVRTVEGMKEGVVTSDTYVRYMKSGASGTTAVLMILVFVGVQTFEIFTAWWLQQWVDSNVTSDSVEEERYITTYASMVGGLIVVAFVRVFWFMHRAIAASRELHSLAFDGTVGSSMRFFDTNPVGRVLNRFSKDVGFVDDMLPTTSLEVLTGVLQILGAVVITCTINAWVLCVVVPLALAFVKLRRFFLKSSREVKRVEGVVRSPIYSLFSTSLEGLTTIRANDSGARFETMMEDDLDDHSRAYLAFIAVSRWFGFRLDAMVFCLLTVAVFVSVSIRDRLEAGEVGLMLIYVIQLSGMLQWIVRQSAEVENQMTSVERILEYAALEPEESVLLPPPDVNVAQWPQRGQLVLANVGLQYAVGDEFILKGISCTINAGEKIGIVGRTGAGKSSMIAALLRMAHVSGTVTLDGVDLAEVPLKMLRSAIAVIPQEPVLFSGTVKQNVDPFGEHSDLEVTRALEAVELMAALNEKDAFVEDASGGSKSPSGSDGDGDGDGDSGSGGSGTGIESTVAEGGSNFSVGQRQLLCLARAILRPTKVLVLDEATANVDNGTDELIQKTIRTTFKAWTVLTIAHRINTVVDSNRIMVLDAGELIEFDTPQNLLASDNGAFKHLFDRAAESRQGSR